MADSEMTEGEMIEAAKLRDRAAAAAQGDRSAWAHLLDVIHAPDARVKQLEEIAQAVAHFDESGVNDGAYACHWCGAMYDGVGDAEATHALACPVTLARALYAPK